jgi:hypothetical protein
MEDHVPRQVLKDADGQEIGDKHFERSRRHFLYHTIQLVQKKDCRSPYENVTTG